MTPEKRKELLHYAANNPNARFTCKEWFNCDIASVTASPELDWEIVKEPVVIIEYYCQLDNGCYMPMTINNQWDLRITTTDGVRVAELRENIK
jgi:hypothetical protein